MKAHIETVDGMVTLKVFYDPALCNRDEAIAAGLASFGLRQGQVKVLAFPFPQPAGTERPEIRLFCILQEKNKRTIAVPKKVPANIILT